MYLIWLWEFQGVFTFLLQLFSLLLTRDPDSEIAQTSFQASSLSFRKAFFLYTSLKFCSSCMHNMFSCESRTYSRLFLLPSKSWVVFLLCGVREPQVSAFIHWGTELLWLKHRQEIHSRAFVELVLFCCRVQFLCLTTVNTCSNLKTYQIMRISLISSLWVRVLLICSFQPAWPMKGIWQWQCCYLNVTAESS